MKGKWICLCMAMVLALALGAGQVWAKDTKECFSQGDDQDGDGYAKTGADLKEPYVKNSKEKLNCPKKYVRFACDCNDDPKADRRASKVHPRAPELANGKDDNCNGLVDEAEFIYPFDNQHNAVSHNRFRIKMKLIDQRVRQVRSLKAKVTVVDLRNFKANPPPVTVNAYRSSTGNRDIVTVSLRGDEATVYRAKVQFIDASTGNNVGDPTEWYYTTTDGRTDDEKRRTGILLRGFHEYNESRLGRVGYRGTYRKNGVKYGANKTRLWCSEFYSWVTKPYLKRMGSRSNIASLRRYFRNYGSYSTKKDNYKSAKRGDYIAMNWKADNTKDHSAMFLVESQSSERYEASSCSPPFDVSHKPPCVWTLEGNAANMVEVRCRKMDLMDGIGRIKAGEAVSNQLACRQWCDSHRSKCAKCDTNITCGQGYKKIKSWTGRGTNWHACAEYTRSKGNREKCEAWCKGNRQCAKCSTKRGCGNGFRRLKSWTKGGTNWHACAEYSRSKGNHDKCKEWCAAHPECAKCSTKRFCGPGYKHLKSWKKGGTNWHACERR